MPSYQSMQMLEFPEHQTKNFQTEEVNDFDLTAEGLDCPPDFRINNYFSFTHYCQAILDKQQIPHNPFPLVVYVRDEKIIFSAQ